MEDDEVLRAEIISIIRGCASSDYVVFSGRGYEGVELPSLESIFWFST